ncbi:MAG: TIGR02117 family protein [Pseudomonadota bacterium]
MRKLLIRSGLLLTAPFIFIAIYLFAALLGAIIPSSLGRAEAGQRMLETPVYLTYNVMHTDIAIPLNSFSLQKFAFLRDAGFPLDNPNLKYLVIGWGARDFYTSTAEYSDMELNTVWKAATGDKSVMHVAPAGDLSEVPNSIRLNISEEGFTRLVEFIFRSFELQNAQPELLAGQTFGYGDLFYKANGQFNLFNPCNIWVSKALNEAGLASGFWTPTTYSLQLNNYLYN